VKQDDTSVGRTVHIHLNQTIVCHVARKFLTPSSSRAYPTHRRDHPAHERESREGD